MTYVPRAKGSDFPACPTWCDGSCDRDGADEAVKHGIMHIRFYGGDEQDDIVAVEQLDTIGIGSAAGGLWLRGPATIHLIRGRRPEEFHLRELSPEQAYAVAGLMLDERLACALLDAVETLAPHLVSVPA